MSKTHWQRAYQPADAFAVRMQQSYAVIDKVIDELENPISDAERDWRKLTATFQHELSRKGAAYVTAYLPRILHEHILPAVDAEKSAIEVEQTIQGQSATRLLSHLISGRDTAATSEWESTWYLAWMTALWRKTSECRVYQPSDGLARTLLATELRGLACSDVTLPLPCVYVQIPDSLRLDVWGSTGCRRGLGAYMSHDSVDGRRGVRVMIVGLGEKEANERSRLKLKAAGVPTTTEFGSSFDFDETLGFFFIDLSQPDQPLTEAVDLLCQQAHAWGAKHNELISARVSDVVDSMRHVWSWLLNVVFYAQHADIDEWVDTEHNADLVALMRRHANAPKGSEKRARLLADAKKQNSDVRRILGPRVEVDPNLPSAPVPSHMTAVTYRKTLVAGHWQRYAVGTGRVDRVWKRREPHWRNLETKQP